MHVENEKPWVIIEEQEYQFIAGNKAGLLKLKEAIDSALENTESNLNNLVESSNINRVVLEKEEKTLASAKTRYEPLIKIGMAIIVGVWFVILPLIGILSIIYFVFVAEPKEKIKCPAFPLQSPARLEANKNP